jgi:hypothetical protein
MAPEQWQDASMATVESEVDSFGVMLYRISTFTASPSVSSES